MSDRNVLNYQKKLREKIIEQIHKMIEIDQHMCIGADIQNYLLKVLEDNMDYNNGYDKGLNDAWELARKIFAMKDNEFDDAFGEVYREDVFNYFDYGKALAKLKAYEEQRKIEVGDVVLIYGEEAVVTRVVDEHANILFGDGVTNNMPVKELVGDKTGKHIDIKSFLEQIGE